MQLSKLEIKGFKSFGDRVVLHFDQGITGVVGPNGSGKSNIVDAIRWVLGEQKTRALRSDKMESVIFNGTKKRKPLQMAEVSLTFLNDKGILPTEYSEVTIARRYYRSGDSEYLLNGVVCRLKDITNLFMDSGIGSDSYAIIELRMVDDILNDRENARRTLFEEASGISKFKLRKRETLRKLEGVDQDLSRVQDVLHEIHKNMKQLERQARQAKKYFEMRDMYKSAGMALAFVTVQSRQSVQQRLEQQIQGLTTERTEVRGKVAESEEVLEGLRRKMAEVEHLLASRRKVLSQKQEAIRQRESEQKVRHERHQLLRDKAESLRRQIDQDQQQNRAVASGLKQLREALAETEATTLRHQEEMTQARAAWEAQKAQLTAQQQETNRLTTQLRQAQDAYFQLTKRLELDAQQLTTIRQELENSTRETDRHRDRLVELEADISDLAEQLAGQQETRWQLQEAENARREELQRTEQQWEQHRDALARLHRTHDALRNEYKLTRALVENLEGYPEATRFLRKEESWQQNGSATATRTPLLPEIISCPDEYRTALEHFLEPWMNYYVVQHDSQAQAAIALLDQAKRGKASFFVLDRFQGYASRPVPALADAVPALSVVQYDERYAELVHFMLDRVYFVTPGFAASDVPPGQTCVSTDGKFLLRAYSLSGGSVGAFAGTRLGQAQRLTTLQEEITQLEAEQETLEAEKATLEARRQTLRTASRQAEIQEIEQQINSRQQQLAAQRARFEQLAGLADDQALRRQELQERQVQLQDDIADLTPDVDQRKAQLATLEAQVQDQQHVLEEEQALVAERGEVFNQANLAFHQQTLRQDSLRQEIEFKEDSYEVNEQRIQDNQRTLVETEQELKNLLEARGNDDDGLKALYEEQTAVQEGVNEAEQEFFAVRGQSDALERDLRDLRRKGEANDALLQELQRKLSDTQMDLATVRERLSIEFNLSDLAKLDMPEQYVGVSEEGLKKSVQSLRDQIEKLGPINSMAMEAYEEIRERYDFIESQKRDLESARQSLVDTIREIDLVAKENFLSTYEQIRLNFQKVFRTLFTEEDTCDLTLVNPSDPLESKIEIMARPKGKRPLTINQLSGGEKTLTAISLLFAIYLIKPAPFCIFDEVDAPLDDTNIDKFNNIIREFSSDSQFIIVTHNKRTMSSVDVIYGITMVEQGVSTVIPVDLRELV
ncbi:condensin subunit Smc [Catalinimonas alkaloidigena]|uniref:Chromosome partition protein Smc n=1 Tax=Catalinimonas alkaloidigena TaxID=1075417 RepID=A0A1G9AZG9_9BACT|nr:chromosome segregation protein SMC [Catalinimonas alkaloidigena]SDK32657.1 condensin subunit Smc [Catalinimonas alkaloidigena]